MDSLSANRPSAVGRLSPALETESQTPETENNTPDARSFSARNVTLPASHARPCGSKRPGLLFFIDNDTDRQTVLENLRNEARQQATQPHKQQQVFYISCPSELESQGLLNRLIASHGEIKKEDGRLFSDDSPLTLAIDLTTMTAGQIASLNELLDTPPRFRGRVIGKGVHLVVLTDDQTGQMIGPDCWRRLKRYRLQETRATADIIPDNETLLNQRVPPLGNQENNQPVIECFTDDDWRVKLFGGFQLNRQGGIDYVEGRLAQLKPGDRLTLKDAPWDNSQFIAALSTALREGGFEANGQWVSLPDNLRLYRSNTPTEVIEAQIKRYSSEGDPDSTCVLIDKYYAEMLSRTNALNDEGICVAYNPLEELAKGCRQIVIQDKLPDAQLRHLLHHFEQMDLSGRPLLIDNRPDPLSGKCQLLFNPPKINTSLISNEKQSFTIPLSFRIAMKENWDTLFQTVTLEDKEKQKFKREDTPLLKAMKSGREPIDITVNISKSDYNDGFLSYKAREVFPTLFQDPPFVMAHGRKIILPSNRFDISYYGPPIFIERRRPQPSADGEPQSIRDALFALDHLFATNCIPDMVNSECKNKGVITALLKKPSMAKKIDMDSNPLSRLYAKRFWHNPHLYGFLKTQIRANSPPYTRHEHCFNAEEPDCFFSDDQADKEGLQQWLQQWLSNNALPDKKDVVKDFWILAKYLPSSCYFAWKKTKLTEDIDQADFEIVAKYLVGAIDHPEKKEALAKAFGIKVSDTGTEKYYYGSRIKLLRHWIIANDLDFQSNKKIFETLGAVLPVLDDHSLSETEKLERVKTLLESTLGKSLPPGFEDFPHALVYGEKHSPSRQFVRMEKLAQDIMSYPVTLLEGEAGTGKTWMAEMAASMVFAESKRPKPSSIKITIGPHTTCEDLYGRQVLKTRADGTRYTTFEKGPLLQWAENPNPPVLILDEANLGQEDLLEPLKGTVEYSPAIWREGKQYPLTEKHRIIMTGNPASYKGRSFDPYFKNRLHVIAYPPMSPQLIMRSLIYPALPPDWDNVLKSHASAVILAQLNHYQPLVPDDVLSPRDIKDLLAHIQHGLRHARNEDKTPITLSKINALIQRAFEQSLDHSVSEEGQSALTRIKQWRQAQFPCDDSILRGVDDGFATFMNALKQNRTDIDFATTSITALVKQYWLMLEKDDGRRGIIVEGPAGWGKDFILTCVLQEWNRQHPDRKVHYHHLNANLNDWDHLLSVVREAMKKGSVIVISELNLIPSAYLEGLFNGLLTGDAAPGFKLIATVNPNDFGGREAFSPALKSRCTQIKLQPFSPQDIKGIITRMSSPRLAEWLAGRFVALEQALKENHLPLRPSMADLSQLVPLMRRFSNSSQWGALFEEHFALEMRQAQVTLTDLNNSLPKPVRKKDNSIPLPPVDLARESGLPQYYLNMGAKENSELKSADLTIPDSVYCPKKNGKIYYDIEKPHSDDSRVSLVERFTRRFTDVEPTGEVGSRFSSVERFTRRFTDVEPTGEAWSEPRIMLELDGIVKGGPTVARTLFSSSFYPERSYRNTLYSLDWDQFWTRSFIDPLAEGISLHTLPPLKSSWTLQGVGAIPGSFSCPLSGQWQPLPGLTPGDSLQTIQCREGWKLEVARSQATGQWLVRSAVPMVQDSEPVTIDFTVKPDSAYNRFPESGTIFESVPDLISQDTRQWLDDHIFSPGSKNDDCPSFNELCRIRQLEPLAQVKALADWCKAFSSSENLDGYGPELVLAMIRQKQGVCCHRGMIFSILAGYFGIPVRAVSNDCHEYIEFSPDRGKHWYRMDLGGGESTQHTVFRGDFSGHSLASRLASPIASTGNFLLNRSQDNHSLADLNELRQSRDSGTATTPEAGQQDSIQLSPLPDSDESASIIEVASASEANAGLNHSENSGTGIDDTPVVKPGPVKHRIDPGVQNWLEGVSTEEEIPAHKVVPTDQRQTELTKILVNIQTSSKPVNEQEAIQIQTLLAKISEGSDVEKRYAYARMLPFLASRPFALFLKDKPDWISLLDTTLSLNNSENSLAQNRTNRLMVLKKLSGHDGFAQSPLCERICQYLEDSGENYTTADYLDVLEHMKTDSAKHKLSYFYGEELGRQRQWPEEENNGENAEVSTQKKGYSKTLKRLLQQTGTATSWQHTYSSGGLSVPRMVAGEPCFKKTVEGQQGKTRPAVVHLDTAVLQELKNIHRVWKDGQESHAASLEYSSSLGTRSTFDTAGQESLYSSSYKTASEGIVDHSLPGDGSESESKASSAIPRVGIKRKQTQETTFEQELEHFFRWLARQDTSTKGQWIVTRAHKKEGGDTIEPGSYQKTPKANDIKAIIGRDNEQGYKTTLDQKRIRRAIKQPSAILVQDKTLHTLFKEWLSLK